jgi:hypothetical protein
MQAADQVSYASANGCQLKSILKAVSATKCPPVGFDTLPCWLRCGLVGVEVRMRSNTVHPR